MSDQVAARIGGSPHGRTVVLAAFLDTTTIVVFVILGRRTHDSGDAITGTIATAAPFLLGLAVAWVATRAWRVPMRPMTGVAVWIITMVVGIAARITIFERTAATAFVVVAAAVTAAGLIGWRLIARSIAGSGSTAERALTTEAP